MRVPSLDIFSHCGAAAAASEADELEHLWALRDAFAAALHTRGPKAQPVIAKLRKATEGLLKAQNERLKPSSAALRPKKGGQAKRKRSPSPCIEDDGAAGPSTTAPAAEDAPAPPSRSRKRAKQASKKAPAAKRELRARRGAKAPPTTDALTSATADVEMQHSDGGAAADEVAAPVAATSAAPAAPDAAAAAVASPALNALDAEPLAVQGSSAATQAPNETMAAGAVGDVSLGTEQPREVREGDAAGGSTPQATPSATIADHNSSAALTDACPEQPSDAPMDDAVVAPAPTAEVSCAAAAERAGEAPPQRAERAVRNAAAGRSPASTPQDAVLTGNTTPASSLQAPEGITTDCAQLASGGKGGNLREKLPPLDAQSGSAAAATGAQHEDQPPPVATPSEVVTGARSAGSPACAAAEGVLTARTGLLGGGQVPAAGTETPDGGTALSPSITADAAPPAMSADKDGGVLEGQKVPTQPHAALACEQGDGEASPAGLSPQQSPAAGATQQLQNSGAGAGTTAPTMLSPAASFERKDSKPRAATPAEETAVSEDVPQRDAPTLAASPGDSAAQEAPSAAAASPLVPHKAANVSLSTPAGSVRLWDTPLASPPAEAPPSAAGTNTEPPAQRREVSIGASIPSKEDVAASPASDSTAPAAGSQRSAPSERALTPAEACFSPASVVPIAAMSPVATACAGAGGTPHAAQHHEAAPGSVELAPAAAGNAVVHNTPAAVPRADVLPLVHSTGFDDWAPTPMGLESAAPPGAAAMAAAGVAAAPAHLQSLLPRENAEAAAADEPAHGDEGSGSLEDGDEDPDEAHVVDLDDDEAPPPLPLTYRHSTDGLAGAEDADDDSDDAMDLDTAVVPRAAAAVSGAPSEDGGAAAMETGDSAGVASRAGGVSAASAQAGARPAWLSPAVAAPAAMGTPAAAAAASPRPAGGELTLPTLAPAASTPGMFTGLAPLGSPGVTPAATGLGPPAAAPPTDSPFVIHASFAQQLEASRAHAASSAAAAAAKPAAKPIKALQAAQAARERELKRQAEREAKRRQAKEVMAERAAVRLKATAALTAAPPRAPPGKGLEPHVPRVAALAPAHNGGTPARPLPHKAAAAFVPGGAAAKTPLRVAGAAAAKTPALPASALFKKGAARATPAATPKAAARPNGLHQNITPERGTFRAPGGGGGGAENTPQLNNRRTEQYRITPYECLNSGDDDRPKHGYVRSKPRPWCKADKVWAQCVARAHLDPERIFGAAPRTLHVAEVFRDADFPHGVVPERFRRAYEESDWRVDGAQAHDEAAYRAARRYAL